MRFPYNPIDDTSIEPAGNIQVSTISEVEEQALCPPTSPLPYWPFWAGICQIVIGFLCVIFGTVEVFVVPFLNSTDAEWSFNRLNCFGAALWSGILLVLCGSCALRASEQRTLLAIQQFYILTVFGFAVNLSLMIFILWSISEIQFVQEPEVKKFFNISLVADIWCLLGCMSLTLTFFNYFCPIVLGHVKLWRSFVVCCCPCYIQTFSSESVSIYYSLVSSTQSGSIYSLNSDDSIVTPVSSAAENVHQSHSPARCHSNISDNINENFIL